MIDNRYRASKLCLESPYLDFPNILRIQMLLTQHFSEDIQPAAGLDGIQEDYHTVVRRNAGHFIDSLEICRIWRGNVARN